MALWNKDVYATEDPLPTPKPIGYSYVQKLRSYVNFAPSFAGFHFDGIHQVGSGIQPQGGGADRFGIQDGGKTCRYWYDHLEVQVGKPARMVVDIGCEWCVVPTAEKLPTFRGIPQHAGVVTVAPPYIEEGLGVLVFDVIAHSVGDAMVVLRAKEPKWFLEESRARRKEEISREKAARKKDAVRQARLEEARRLIYGSNPPPMEDEKDASGQAELPPLWGKFFGFHNLSFHKISLASCRC